MKMAGRNRDAGELQYFLTYREERESLSALTDAQKGRLYTAKFDFFFDGNEPDFADDQALAVLWSLIRSKLDTTRRGGLIRSVTNSYRAYLRDFMPDTYHVEPLPIGAWFDWKRQLLDTLGNCPTAYLELSPEDLPDVRPKDRQTPTDVL